MSSLVLALVLAQAQTGNPAQQPHTGNQPGVAGQQQHMGQMPRVEGTWKVLAMQVNGQPLSQSHEGQVTIRNNVLSFSGMNRGGSDTGDRSGGTTGSDTGSTTGRGAAGNQSGLHQDWVLVFGAGNTLTAMPARGHQGAGDENRNQGQGNRRGQGGNQQGHGGSQAGQGQGGLHGQGGIAMGNHGVYVLCGDYLCLSLGNHERTAYYPRPGQSGQGQGQGGNQGQGGGTTGGTTGGGVGGQGGHQIVLVLKRQGGSEDNDRNRDR